MNHSIDKSFLISRRFFHLKAILIFFLVYFYSHTAFSQDHIRILFWSDFHSHNTAQLRGSGGSQHFLGGMGLLSGAVKQFRSDSIPAIAIDAGDQFQGTPISSITKGASQIKLLNLICPDIFTIGNHEFDYGTENLLCLLKIARFSMVSANIVYKESGDFFVQPYKIVQVGNVKIGFLGVITPELPNLVFRKNIARLDILDPIQTAEKYVAMLKDSVDLFIIVSHSGITWDKRLAETVNGIDVILGGHSHIKMSKPQQINGTWVFHTGSYGEYLGKLDVWVDTASDTITKSRGELLPLQSTRFKTDSLVQWVVDSLEQVAAKDLDKIIAELRTDWIRKGCAESNIGNWITDAFRQYTGADIAFQNSGGIRKNLKKGPVTKRDLWEIAPFEDYIVTFSVKGSELFSILERNLNGKGEFLLVSGIQVWYDLGKPIGSRIQKILVQGQPVHNDKIYTVATNNFLIDHFHDVFGLPAKGRSFKQFPKLYREVLIDAASQQKIIISKSEQRMFRIH